MKWALVGLIIGCNAVGDTLNTMGMRRYGEVQDFHPNALVRLVTALARNRFVVGGVIAMGVAFFALMSLLSIAPLSFAVPATGATYIAEVLMAKYVLRERINWERWAGASCVAFGVALLAF